MSLKQLCAFPKDSESESSESEETYHQLLTANLRRTILKRNKKDAPPLIPCSRNNRYKVVWEMCRKVPCYGKDDEYELVPKSWGRVSKSDYVNGVHPWRQHLLEVLHERVKACEDLFDYPWNHRLPEIEELYKLKNIRWDMPCGCNQYLLFHGWWPKCVLEQLPKDDDLFDPVKRQEDKRAVIWQTSKEPPYTTTFMIVKGVVVRPKRRRTGGQLKFTHQKQRNYY